jgi:hypothetical protein
VLDRHKALWHFLNFVNHQNQMLYLTRIPEFLELWNTIKNIIRIFKYHDNSRNCCMFAFILWFHCDMIVWKFKRIPLTYLTFREIKTHHSE